MDFGPFSVAIAFWVFVGVCAVAGIVGDYKKRQAALDRCARPSRRASSSTRPWSSASWPPMTAAARLEPIDLQVGGIVTVAAGIGVAILAFFMAQIAPVALYPIMGGGIVAVCVGVGLVVAARAVERARRDAGART